ncbi:MAG: ATP-binding protein [Muribaculaceae bacterium]|nr:ATP-binding protein [Muribaculaceae bacterium]
MYRKLYSQLLSWKNSANRKPLLLLGARQVGKTWLMKEFGEKEYENVVYINCDDEPLTRELFSGDYDIQRLILGFQAISGETISEAKTLIILDELQEAPRGLHSLKYFCENAPGYHVMAAGSLLGVTIANEESFPVGKVEMLRLYPMDFEEFLHAVHETKLSEILAMHNESLIAPFSTKLTDLLRQYMFVGGMPEVVQSFVVNKDLAQVRKLQSDIIEAYRRDISKHTSKIESVRIGQVMASLPSQLAKENKKFIYGVAKPGGRAAEFELAIQWLIDAGLVYKVPRVKKVALPLPFYEDFSAFKLFFLDVGLLACLSDIKPASLLLDPSILTEFRGMISEEYVCQQLVAANFKLFYWSNDSTPAELDFVIDFDDRPVPIEVKASTNVRSRSLSQFLKNNPEVGGVRFSLAGYFEQDRLTNYPLYTIPYYFNQA